jgi:hypothetical protein
MLLSSLSKRFPTTGNSSEANADGQLKRIELLQTT